MARIIMCGSFKGGVGKTASSWNLAYSLAEMGKRVLAVDFDSQANLTTCFGIEDPAAVPVTIGHLMMNRLEDEEMPDLSEFIQSRNSVDFISSSMMLSAVDSKLRMEMGSEKMLTGILEPLRGLYDYIIVDTCPSLGTLTINALTAADEVIIAVNPQLLAMMGLQDFIRTVKKVRSRLNDRLQISGILLTMCDARTNLCKVITEQLTETFDGQIRIFKSIIPNTVKVGEKENIWTQDAKGEMLLTILSSFAQEESRSISENTTWGKRKQFADGKGAVAYSRFLGYDKDFEINEEEAKIIRLIFRLFISRKTFYRVAQEIERRGIPSPAGKRKWYASTVKSIITNEKYKGDALFQKQYTTDFLQKKRKKNEGEIPQYYVEGHHKPIIPPPVFDYVQAEIVRRSKMGRYSGADIFANKVRCGCCGNWYGVKVWHSQDKYRRVIYRCNKKYQKGKEPCESPHFSESELKEIFMKALNLLIEEKEECIDNLKELIEDACQTDDLEAQQESLETEMELLTEKSITLSGKIQELYRIKKSTGKMKVP